MREHSEEPVYVKPVIVDHGDLKELTAHGGPLVTTDVPLGTPSHGNPANVLS